MDTLRKRYGPPSLWLVCKTVLIGAGILAVASCAGTRELVGTPNLFSASGFYPETGVPDHLKTTTPDLFFVTDRKFGEDGKYGVGRSPSMAFGRVRVSFGDNMSWHQLARISGQKNRDVSIPLHLDEQSEIVRFPATPLPFSFTNGKLKTLAASRAKYESKKSVLQKRLASELRAANKKEIVLFVHGFNNTFEDAAFGLADIWHFTGRVGVPVFYTWPAGNGGLTGYFKDSEAGNYSIFHFKETMRILSTTPGLERIHIVAHSRGTDVVTTGLRELVIEHRAQGKNPRNSLKIQNLILAAPDLDFGIVRQRLIAERFGPAIGQITVYLNQNDGALGLSQRIAAGKRFGRLTFDDLGVEEKAIFSRVKNVNFVDIPDVDGLIGHAYFRENPGVLSDIAIAIRHGAAPGEDLRPLEHVAINFWELPKDYPYQENAAQ